VESERYWNAGLGEIDSCRSHLRKLNAALVVDTFIALISKHFVYIANAAKLIRFHKVEKEVRHVLSLHRPVKLARGLSGIIGRFEWFSSPSIRVEDNEKSIAVKVPAVRI
jgi:hypothetical protein